MLNFHIVANLTFYFGFYLASDRYKDDQIDRQIDMDRSLTDNVIKVNMTRPLENQNVTG